MAEDPRRAIADPLTNEQIDAAVDKIRGEACSALSKQRSAFDRARPLCPDHRDKASGRECLMCEIERLQKRIAELEATVKALSDGVNRRCGCGPNELPIVSLDRKLKELERERDEAREAAREIYSWYFCTRVDDGPDLIAWRDQWPWLEGGEA